MNKFKEYWNTYNLSVNTCDDEVLTLSWADVETLSFYSTIQSGQFGKQNLPFSKQVFFEHFPTFYKGMWAINEKLNVYNIPKNSTVIDIGSGVSVLDLLLLKKFPQAKVFLIDKEELDLKENINYSNNYFFYNTWAPVIDCLENSDISKDSVTFLDPNDNWPDQADLITSYFSWCMHYPKETYWDKVLKTLKPGGKLVVDIRNLKDRDIVEEISDELGVKPMTFKFQNSVPKWIDKHEDSVLGWRCSWTKKEK